MIVISLLISRLGRLWGLTSTEKGLLGSAVFFGFFIGALISGKISDNYGRKPTFIIGSAISATFAMASAFSPDYTFLLIFRALFGAGVGMSVPSCSSLATEITPTKYRSYALNGVWLFFPLGEIFAVIIAKYVLDTEDGWRLLLGVVGVPNAISCLLSIFINESPRFYITSRRFDKAFINLERILEYSKEEEKVKITDEMKNRIIEEEIADVEVVVKSDYSTLFNKTYLRLTLQVCAVFFICSFAYYGLVFIQPQVMEENESESVIKMTKKESQEHLYTSLIISALAEFSGVFFSAFLTNLKCLGRLKAMALGFLLTMISSIFGAAFLDYLNISSAFFKFSISTPFNGIYVYVCEAYPTSIRSLAVGVSNAFTRLGGILTPVLTQIAFSYANYSPLVIYALLCLGGIFLTIFLPFETLGRDIE